MTPPPYPAPSTEGSRTFYTPGQMRQHHKAWQEYVAYLLEFGEEAPRSSPQDSKAADDLMKMFGMKP